MIGLSIYLILPINLSTYRSIFFSDIPRQGEGPFGWQRHRGRLRDWAPRKGPPLRCGVENFCISTISHWYSYAEIIGQTRKIWKTYVNSCILMHLSYIHKTSQDTILYFASFLSQHERRGNVLVAQEPVFLRGQTPKAGVRLSPIQAGQFISRVHTDTHVQGYIQGYIQIYPNTRVSSNITRISLPYWSGSPLTSQRNFLHFFLADVQLGSNLVRSSRSPMAAWHGPLPRLVAQWVSFFRVYFHVFSITDIHIRWHNYT